MTSRVWNIEVLFLSIQFFNYNSYYSWEDLTPNSLPCHVWGHWAANRTSLSVSLSLSPTLSWWVVAHCPLRKPRSCCCLKQSEMKKYDFHMQTLYFFKKISCLYLVNPTWLVPCCWARNLRLNSERQTGCLKNILFSKILDLRMKSPSLKGFRCRFDS